MRPADRDSTHSSGRRGAATGSPRSTRETIAQEAAELFAEVGFRRASLRTVAARAGTDPALVRHYFGTKDELFAEVVTATLRPARVLAEALDGGGDPGAARWLLANVLADWVDPRQFRRIMGVLRSALDVKAASGLLQESLVPTGVARDPQDETRMALVGSLLVGVLLTGAASAADTADAGVSDGLAGLGEAVLPVVEHYLAGEPEAVTRAQGPA